MKKFDSIRPYHDDEVHQVLIDLSNNRRFLKMLFSTGRFNKIRYLPFSRKVLSLVLKNRIKNIKSVSQYQDAFEAVVSEVIKNSIKKFSITGIENLDPNKGYLFVANHRDITLDSALLNFTLHQNNFKTTYNAVGNNLLSEKWASDLMRLNKSFIIDRSDKSKRDIYKSLNLASEFIYNTIVNENESIWIAQKQGRSKDGNDYTDPSVIKMIHLNARKKLSVNDYLNSLNLIPVSISYEKDPNDLLKAKEMYLTDLNQKYIKERKEDMESIFLGINGSKGDGFLNAMGYSDYAGSKGDVHLNIGKAMHFDSDSYEECSDQITEAIKQSYQPHSTNYAAAVIQGKPNNNSKYSPEEINDAIEYLENRMNLIPEDMRPYFLNQYSNSVIDI